MAVRKRFWTLLARREGRFSSPFDSWCGWTLVCKFIRNISRKR